MTKMTPPNVPSGLSLDVVVTTKQDLEIFRSEVFAAGVARGRFEERMDQMDELDCEAHTEDTGRTPNLPGHLPQGRGGPDADDQAAPGSTSSNGDGDAE